LEQSFTARIAVTAGNRIQISEKTLEFPHRCYLHRLRTVNSKKRNNSLAVAEMGDRLATIDMG